MSKQLTVLIMALVVLTTAPLAEAQPAGTGYRIGFLGNSSPTADSSRIEAFRQGLCELGYAEGKNVVIEFRYAAGKLDRLPALAAELVHLLVDVLVARGTWAAQAAQQATRTIPIVMAMVADPVRSGLIASLARPGGNVTGLTTIMPELTGKQLELLRTTVPTLARVALLARTGGYGGQDLYVQEAQDAAQSLGLQMQLLRIKGPEAFEGAFAAMTRERAGALVVQPFLIGGLGHGQRLADLAVRRRLPTVSSQRRFADEGGLISYGPDVLDMTRRLLCRQNPPGRQTG